MPMYDYICVCGREWESCRTIEDRDKESCSHCGISARRILSMSSKPIIMEYYSESLDAVITGPKQKSRIMKEKNVSEMG